MNGSHPDSFELADYLGVLRRRWLVLVIFTVIGVLAAGAYLQVAKKVYTATTSIYVTAVGGGANQLANSKTAGQGSVNMDNEAQVATSYNVGLIAARLLNTSAPVSSLLGAITTAVPPNSQVLQIGCGEPSGAEAAACSRAFATAYLQNRKATALRGITAELTPLNAQIAALQKSQASLEARLNTLPKASAAKASAQATLQTYKSQLNALNTQEAALSAQKANSSGGYVITAASTPTAPSSPKTMLILPGGLMVGLLLGLVGAFVADSRDKRIHSTREVENVLDVPVLLSMTPKELGGQGLAIAPPRSRVGRKFTELAHSIAVSLGSGNHVLLVAGTSPGASGSLVAANLAASLARTHSGVTLVCADLGGTATPRMLGFGESRGLAEVLAGSASISEVARRPADAPRLRVISPGLDTSIDPYQFQHDTIEHLVSQLRAEGRYVLIEAQGSEEDMESFALAEFADAAVVVVEVAKTTRNEALDVVGRLHRLRTTVLGAVALPSLGKAKTGKGKGKAAPPPRRQPEPPPPASRRSSQDRRFDDPVSRGVSMVARDDSAGSRDDSAGSRSESAGSRADAGASRPRPDETLPLPRALADDLRFDRKPRIERDDPADTVTGS